MDKHLDESVSQAVYMSKLLERALHDSGPWTLSWGPFVVPVTRLISNSEVTFRAEFPEHCWLEPPVPVAILHCADEALAAKTIDFPGDGAFAVEWTLRAVVREIPA